MGQHRLKNVAASVRQRLLNRARERDEEYQLILERYVQERFLRRLEQSRHEEAFVLKGATLFIPWQGERHRVTRDLDLLRFGRSDAEHLKERIEEICQAEVEEDGVEFQPETVQVAPIREDQAYGGLRAKVEARIGSARIHLQINVGFGDATGPLPERTIFPALLEDFEGPRPRAYSKEAVVAEKFEAMVDLGIANSRMKDFYDVWFLAGRFAFEGAPLAEAIRRTFERRGTPLPDGKPPVALTDTFAGDEMKRKQWDAFVRKGRLQTEQQSLEEVVSRIRLFLIEPAAAASQSESLEQRWPPGGPWEPVA